MRAMMLLKYSPLAIKRSTISACTALKPYVGNFKFSTQNIVRARYGSFKTPSLTSSPKVNAFNFVSKKNLSDATQTKTVNLSEQEAYILNEHDRMVIQLTSNVVPMTALPKFMKELTEYCFYLSKYKEYIKGWNYVAKFFQENLKNFSNEDLSFYVGIFSLTGYMGETIDFWKNIGQEVLNRTLGKDQIMGFFGYLVPVHNYFPNDFWTSMVRKLDTLDISDFEDSILVAAMLGALEYTKDDQIWERLLSNVENKEISLKHSPLTFLLKAANTLRQKVSKDSPFYEQVRVYVLNNFQSTPGEFVPILCSEFVKFSPPKEEDLVSLIIQSLSMMKDATQKVKLDFYVLVFGWCYSHSNLISLLEKNKANLGDFVVPTYELVSDFAKYQKELSTLKPIEDAEKIKEIHNDFWLKNAEKIGFRTAFAQYYAIHGASDYTSLEETYQKIKAEV